MRQVIVISLIPWLCQTYLHAQEPRLVVRSGHGDPVSCLALSPDGKWLVTGHYEEKGSGIRIWDAATGRLVRQFLQGASVRSVSFSADGNQIITSGDRVSVWEAATGKRLQSGPKELGARNASFSKNGKFVVAVDDDGARVWEPATGKVVGPYGGAVDAAVLSADGKLLVWGDARDVMIVDWAADKVIHKLPHSEKVTSLCLSDDGKWLATGCYDQTVRLWDMADGKKIRAFVGHNKPEEGAGRSAQGDHFGQPAQ